MKRRIIGFPMVGNTGQNWRASFYIVSRFLPSLVSVVSFCFCGNKKGGARVVNIKKGGRALLSWGLCVVAPLRYFAVLIFWQQTQTQIDYSRVVGRRPPPPRIHELIVVAVDCGLDGILHDTITTHCVL